MRESARERHERWRLADLLRQYPLLRIAPSANDDLVLEGRLAFYVAGPDGEAIADEYRIEVEVPPDFPRTLALVRETGRRIPPKHHKLEGDYLCLGTPTEQRLVLASSPTLPYFVSQLVVPYLFGYSYFLQHGELPFGEEDHGDQGIRNHLGRLFHAPAVVGVEEFLQLTSLKKRSANKRPCPCRSGRRLGRCHNRVVNRLRRRLGTGWCRDEYGSVCALLGKSRGGRRPREVKSPTLREALGRQTPAAERGASGVAQLLETATQAVQTLSDALVPGDRRVNSA